MNRVYVCMQPCMGYTELTVKESIKREQVCLYIECVFKSLGLLKGDFLYE